MSGYWLALDQGGHAGRAIAFDRRGGILAQAVRDVATESPAPGWYEQDPEAVVASLEGPLTDVLAALGPASCLGAGLATQRSSIACWDRETGEALAPVISWRDTRRADWLEALDPDPARLRAITGLRASAHYGASKLRWCLDELPRVRAAEADGRLACGPLASFLIFRLTRERSLFADPANASRTLLWDLGRRDWSPSLLDLFRLPRSILPEPAPVAGRLGHLRLAGSVPLALATGDQSAALFATGAPRPGEVTINAGTGAFALQLAPWPNDEDRLLTSLVRDDPITPVYALEGTVNGAGTALDAAAAELGLTDWPAVLDELPDDSPSIVYLNGHSGVGSPWWQPRLASRWLEDGPAPAKLLGVLESVVFLLVTNLRRLAARCDDQEGIRLGGGLSRSRLFVRRLADLSRLPVLRAPVTEATARGLAWLVAGDDPAWPTPPDREVRPRPDPALDARYARWLGAMTEATGFDPV
jgi:glycerol kinase